MAETRDNWPAWKTVVSMVIGAALGGGVYGIAEARHARDVPPPPPAAEMVEVARVVPPPAAADPAPAPEEPAAKAPEPEEDPKARALAARTAAEQALLDEARTQLEENNAAAAQATLDRMKKRYARGALVQERELLRIEVYKARGQMPAAKRAARKFVKAYPDNPHLDQLDTLTKI